jgi:hypothetical protein
MVCGLAWDDAGVRTADAGFRRRLTGLLFGPPPFDRQVHVHALSAAADAFVAVSLAGSLFFSVSVDAARPRIVLYLLLTMAPFALVAPFIGPMIDRIRGGNRLVLVVACVARAGLCLLMVRDLRTLFFYPEAFAVLVLGKTYSVAKSALVPRLVTGHEDLVAANSRLSRIGTLGGSLGGATAVGLSVLGGAQAALWGAALVYLGGAVVALRLPRPPTPGVGVPRGLQYEELHTPEVVLDAGAMAALRASVGFLAFLLAFGLKSAGEPVWMFGMVIAAGGLGGFAGTFIAPVLRRRFAEERLLSLALVAPAVLALYAGASFDRATVTATALVLGVSANVGSQAFSSLLQRHAPEADRGRAFAAFEARFQLAWVGGALVPVLVYPPTWLGLVVLGVALVGASVVHEVGTRARHRVEARRPTSEAIQRAVTIGYAALADAERFRAEGDLGRSVLTALSAVRAASEAGATAPTAPARLELELVWRGVLAGHPVTEDQVSRALASARAALDVVAEPVVPQAAGSSTGISSGSPATRHD